MKLKFQPSTCLLITVLALAGCAASGTSKHHDLTASQRSVTGSASPTATASQRSATGSASPTATARTKDGSPEPAHMLVFKITGNAPTTQVTYVLNGKKTSQQVSILPRTLTMSLPPRQGPDTWQLTAVTTSGTELITVLVDGQQTAQGSVSGEETSQFSGTISGAAESSSWQSTGSGSSVGSVG